MRRKTRIGTEAWGLLLLFVAFLAFAAYYERVGQETTAREVASTFNTKEKGVKALYLLFQQERYNVTRLESTWNALTPEDRLLIVIEPLMASRKITPGELDALHDWIEAGGTVLYFVTAPARPLNKADSVAGDVAIKSGPQAESEVAPRTEDSPFTRDVTHLAVQSPVRLEPEKDAGYTTLFADESGALALQKPLGKGQVILVANAVATSNAAVRKADNAVFLVNIAAATVGAQGGQIVFDEYHHGVGFTVEGDGSNDSLMENVPFPIRLALWHLLGLGAILLYNGNRRFGRPRALSASPYHASTDYVGSMARLYRRAGAADIAILTLYKAFLRDITKQLDLSPDANPAAIAQRAERQYHCDNSLLQTMQRCEQIVGGQRIGEGEMLTLTHKLESFRRKCDLVGI